jgi:glutamate N-acetyltransferase / amino-acid N-acetyltransferase
MIDPTERAEPAQRIEPTQPVGRVEPAGRAEPVVPTDPTRPPAAQREPDEPVGWIDAGPGGRLSQGPGCGGVTAPGGFRAAGVAAGLKSTGALDVALVVNDGPRCDAAAVFTTNRIKAAPVLWTQQCARDGRFRAVILNSGGANACTGPEGFADTHRTAEHVAEILGIGPIEVAVCSTGLIGERLPMPALLGGVDAAAAALADDGGPAAAEAIMTTDSRPKLARFDDPAGWTVAGMAKGAGMLAPGLATMLVVLTTDAEGDAEALDTALRAVTARTFDRVDSDGCMSTNDTVLLLASGASGVRPPPPQLADAVESVCRALAAQLVNDAEGATKDISITAVNAGSEADAVVAARAVARSNLVKCAIHGEDPNWGRILAAVGTTDATFDPDAIDVAINGVQVCRGGAAFGDRAAVDMSGRHVQIQIDLHVGNDSATVWTNDLTAMYVHENSAYST